jgi:hypothetical protein
MGCNARKTNKQISSYFSEEFHTDYHVFQTKILEYDDIVLWIPKFDRKLLPPSSEQQITATRAIPVHQNTYCKIPD